MKRFYDTVGTQEVAGGWQVTLDGRGLKTVKTTPQIVPTLAFAKALAAEWDAQSETLDPQTFPARDLADYAIDMVSADPAAVAAKTLTYGDTDTLLYRADPDEPLYARQQEIWEPIVSDFEAREGVDLTRVSGVLHRPQSGASLEKLRARLLAHDPFALAGIELMTTLAASLVVGLSAIRPEVDAEALWQAASLEEEWQADLWGREYEAEERRAKRQHDFLKAREVTLLALGETSAA